VIGQDAERLSRHYAVWHRLREARALAREADDLTLLAYARDDLTALSLALSEFVAQHEPRDGSPWCPQCSAGSARVLWPCPVWQGVEKSLGR
jgi:hypothetical protein